jgi:Protein of unknown function (DUF3551)
MRKLMTAASALFAVFATSGKVHADVNYPWCIIGDTRAVDCYFSSREQCMQDGRNRGFGGQCIQNPYYKPGVPTVSDKNGTVRQTARPSRAVSAAQSTCTGLKLACLSSKPERGKMRGCLISGGADGVNIICGGKACNSEFEECMKTGWWQHAHQAERR